MTTTDSPLLACTLPTGDAKAGRCGCARGTADSAAAPYVPTEPGRALSAARAAALPLGMGVVACAACCLPIAFPALALAGGGGLLALLASVHTVLVALALVAAAIAWGWIAWLSIRTRKRPAPFTLGTMLAVTAVLGIAIVRPMI